MNTREKHPFVLILAFCLSLMASQATPVISVQPQNQTVAVGTTARFSVEALSDLPMTYEWRWLTNATRGTNISGATDATLSLENAMISGVRFVAVVSDSGGSVTSQVARLTVIYPPGLVDPPLTQFAWAGQPVTFKVLTTNTSVLRYQWLLNGASLPKGSNATYSISRAHATNEGDYQVILTNLAGSLTSRVAHLTVRSMPPPTGASFLNLTNLERGLLAVLQQHAVPAASLAIMKDGRLMAARGYGFADADTGELTQPDSLFRIGSLSKAITATAMLRLVEQGKLSLEDKVFPLLNPPPPTFPGAKVDQRLNNITIRNLLNHTSGWDRYAALNPEGTVGFDPTWWLERCSADLGISRVPTARELLGWITGFPLQSDPGAAYAYSNNGYVTCRVIIEQVTGQSYVDYIRSMLAPIGITRMAIQGTTREERLPDEVVQWFSPAFLIREVGYWQTPPAAVAELAYWYPFEPRQGTAGWMISSLNYARFIAAVDGLPQPADILSAASLKTMLTPTQASRNAEAPYGMGWHLDESSGEISHSGWGVTITTYASRRKDGITYVVYCATEDDALYADLQSVLDAGVAAIKNWPDNDLFPATLSFEAWQARHFDSAELADAAVSGETADPDHDRVPNLLEYASGSDPRSSVERWQPLATWVTVGGKRTFALTFRRLLLAHELNYSVEASGDLIQWTELSETTGLPVLNADGTQTVVVPDVLTADENNHRFLRLKVVRVRAEP